MSILNKLDEKFGGLKLGFIKYLSCVEYIEYVVKHLLLLGVERVELCLWVSCGINVVLLFSSLLFTIAIKRWSLVLSCLISFAFCIGFTIYRKRNIGGDTTVDYEIGEIEFKPLDKDKLLLKDVPVQIKKYFKE